EVGGIREPLRGLLEAALEALEPAVSRAPAEQTARLAIIGEQALDLALVGPKSDLLGDHLNVRAHHRRNRLGGVADRDLEVAAQVDHFADGIFGSRGGEEA